MKKQILFALPLMAAMLLSCKSNKSKGNPTSADLPDPNAPGVTEVEQNVAYGKLSSAVGKIVAADALGLQVGVSLDANINLTVPKGNGTASDKLDWETGTAEANATATVEVNAKGLKNTGVQNYRANAAMNFAESVHIDIPDSVGNMIALIGTDLDPEVLKFLSDFNLDTNGDLSAYFDGTRAYLDISQDFVDAVHDIAELNGATVDENNIQAGKFKSPEIPLNDYFRNFNFAAFVQQYTGDVLTNIDTYAAQYIGMFEDYFTEFKALKYSDNKYALYAEADLLPILMAQLPADAAQYATMIDALLDDNDKLTATVGVVYDIEKGVESIGAIVEADVEVTYLDIVAGLSGADEATRDAMRKQLGGDADKKIVDAQIALSASIELKTGTDVTVVELTDAQKAEYKDMPTGGAKGGQSVPSGDAPTGPVLA